MKHLKVASLATLFVASAFAPAARADVAWQHSITTQIPGVKSNGSAVLQLAWSGQQQRARVAWYGATTTSGAPVSFASGNATLVTDLEADRLLAYTTADTSKTAIEVSRTNFVEAGRYNPFRRGPVADSRLANADVPRLTREQRRRLGAELRAVARPLIGRSIKTYFRPLPNRTINGISGRGYRFTQLIVANKQPAQRTSIEWYLADELPGDGEIRDFFKSARSIYDSPKGYPTTSMWLNEILPVLYYTLPEESQEALETFSLPNDPQRGGFGGTPLLISMTIFDPTTALFSSPVSTNKDTAVRVTVTLSKRTTDPLPERVFAVPASYKRRVVTAKEIQEFLNDTENQVQNRAGFPTASLFAPR